MKSLLIGIVMCCTIVAAQAQNTIRFSIKNSEDQTPLAGATVTWQSQNKSIIADSTGMAIVSDIPNGPQSFLITFVGFGEKQVTYTFPLAADSTIAILLEHEEEEHEEEVIVSATRTSRTIANTPTRVEVISGEELEEKGNMKPGDIRMMLNESTGIQTQQTSATSYNSSIRIQGLDGRYTQILRDGYPLYAGFSGGLSIMQIAPLDLRQVEVIKGSSSTLYGGGAIAGLVNLVSKTPRDERELSFMANSTSAKGLDLSGFYSEKYGKAGLTVFGSANFGSPYDPADIGLTAIPKFSRYTINPRLFLYGNKTTANVGFSYVTEDRTGGNINYIKNGGTGYFEENNTDRFTTQVGISHRIGNKSTLNFKNSYSRFDRSITIPAFQFEGVQQSSFTEITYNTEREKAQWIIGANFLTDDFAEERHSTAPLRDYHYNTFGVFLQNAWSPTDRFTLESGLRGDYVKDYGFELLPRISALFKVTPKLTTRIGGGFGYKTPTVFNEESERIQFRNILPINNNTAINERSVGGNFDINYRTNMGEVGFSINQLFFYTRLNKPLVLTSATGGDLEFKNADGHTDTKGFETNLKFTYGDFKLFIGYTYADVNNNFDNVKSWLPLTARHRLNNVLMFEKEEKLKIGLEAYYTSRQKLNDGSFGKPYWITGLMVEKIWEKFSVFINFENFIDTRQTKFDTIFTGSIDNPVFRDIYAPVDGFVVNGGIKVRL
ncbi:MAG: TonB-dependent receptor domain-containing protein [Chitinophagaceae bacterium]